MVERNLTMAKSAAPMLRQVMVSVAATIIATATLTVIQHQFAAWQTPMVPSLTSGGKFAARLESMTGIGDETAPAASVAPLLPILLSMPLPPWTAIERVATPTTPEPPKLLRRAYRAESRPRMIAAPSSDGVTPPRRVDVLAEAAPVGAAIEEADVWRSTKTLAHQVLGAGNAMWARITPTQWLP